MRDPGDAGPAPWVVDLLLGIGVTLTVSVFIAADIQDSEPDGWAYLWAVGLGGLMLVRRRYPVIVVVLSAGAVLSYYAAGYPAIGVAVPLAAAAFSAAEFDRMVAAVITCTTVLLISVVYRVVVSGQDPSLVLWFDAPGHALLLGAAIALGDNVRSRRRLRRQATEIAALVAERSASEAEQRAMSERLAIARELHDSVGHALTVVSLHAQIAEEALDADPGSPTDDAGAREALRVITETTASSFEDVRRTVANLRKEHGAARPALRLGDLDRAVSPAMLAGLDVRTRVTVASALPAPVESAIVRIVQESITNVIRHANASRVEVAIAQHDGRVEVSVVDDGGAGAADAGTADPPGRPPHVGSGLAGMRERATLLGGTFSAAPTASGFAVRASIPLEVPG